MVSLDFTFSGLLIISKEAHEVDGTGFLTVLDIHHTLSRN